MAAIPNAEYPLTAQCLSPSVTVLAWGSAPLTALIEHYPILAVRAMQMVTGRFVQLQNLYRELATLRVEQRIARALVRLTRQAGTPDQTGGTLIGIPLSRQHLADMTGTTLYTVSRTLSAWEQRGIVTSGRERVIVRNLEGLTALADDVPPRPSQAEPPPC
ncbi:MAG: Crp/Fnr family transcriptional regulator [Chloroflexaceae bacterium]|nr:Crp/Fnr family transcriptional regulator [Chloroflexaceae bacterium]